MHTGGKSDRVRLLTPRLGRTTHLMHPAVYHVMTLVSLLVSPMPIGTNQGLLHLLWMMVSGRLLATRGAVIPGLDQLGLPPTQVRRAWAALAHGSWTSTRLLAQWATVVAQDRQWQAHTYDGYHPVAVDVTGFWRPRLASCATTHYDATAGKALPAIPVGLIARVGEAAGQRLGLPLALVRAAPHTSSTGAHTRRLVQTAVAVAAADDVLVFDRGFPVSLLQDAHATAYVARLPKNFTARRARPPAYAGRGRPPTRGVVVRPLARRRGGRLIAATPPEQVTTFLWSTRTIRAERWADLLLPTAPAGSPTCTVWAFHDPRYAQPLLVATSLDLSAAAVYHLYRDRWPVEQLPLAAKQMIGAARQFVSAPETCQRLPELALLAGAVLSYAAATCAPVPTGFWDRRPARTPGRLRRVLARAPFPHNFTLPAHIRAKAAVTRQLRTGGGRQPRRAHSSTPTSSAPSHATPLARVA
jgi:hypothetical protein